MSDPSDSPGRRTASSGEAPVAERGSAGSSLPPALPAVDNLPPVEPPSAGFILKLFVIPGVIVTAVLLVVLAFNWLTHLGSNPESYVTALERNARNRWQVAHDLSVELRGNDKLRGDSAFARRVSAVAEKKLAEPPPTGTADEVRTEVYERVYFCKLLGEFSTPEGLEVLENAALRRRNENELDVQLAALESIAVLVDNVRKAGGAINTPSLATLLNEASRTAQEPTVRSRAAFALGVLGGPAAEESLQRLLKDGYPDARFNAAAGLARHGHDDPATIDVLAEMLDPEQTAGLAVEEEAGSRDFKRAAIHMNGLRAIEMLLQTNPQAKVKSLEPAIEKLSDEERAANAVRLKAREVLHQMAEAR